jgi:hypothetical protein
MLTAVVAGSAGYWEYETHAGANLIIGTSSGVWDLLLNVAITVEYFAIKADLDLFLVFRRPLGGVGRAILPAACFQQALVGNEEAD